MPATVLQLLAAVSSDTSDAELLGRFVAARDESAFAELVRRHGPSVYRVCRRLVGPSSADDAFQATFLVLACRAKAVRKAASVGSWLIGVAGRVSRQMRARERALASRHREVPGDSLNPAPHGASPEVAELSAILTDELARLPDTLRDPVVLCLVEGHTQEQASAALGGSVRTLRRRLDRAKAVLRARLERRGIVPTVAAGLVAGLGSEAVAVPPRLAERAVSGVFEFLAGGPVTPAAVVAKGVVGNMVKFKASVMMATVAVAMIGLGVGWAHDPPSAIPPQDVPVRTPPPVPDQTRTPPPAATPKSAAVAPPQVGWDKRMQPDGWTVEVLETHRTPNFVVYTANPVFARAIAAEAEFQRKELAKLWLGKELPDWSTPCAIQYDAGRTTISGSSSFTFISAGKEYKGIIAEKSMRLSGPFVSVLTNTVPHEVMHAVMATHFGKDPLPRWADEGLAVCAESDAEQTNHDIRCRELLNAGRGIRLKALFQMKEYPRDMITIFAQGHSVVRFLLACPVKQRPAASEEKDGKIIRTWRSVPYDERMIDGQKVVIAASYDPAKPHQALLAFIEAGAYKNTAESWDKAAKEVYGFESVDKLEEAWVESLRKPPSWPTSKSAASIPAKPQEPELIPPTKLPGVERKP